MTKKDIVLMIITAIVVGLTLYCMADESDLDVESKKTESLRTVKLTREDIVDVIDGDTFKYELKGKRHTVRIYGIDAPELTQMWGAKSRNALVYELQDWLEITLIVVNTDKYDRQVCIVMQGVMDVGASMIRQGHAFYYPETRPVSNVYKYYERLAEEQMRGLWKESLHHPAALERPWEYRKAKSE